MNSFDIFHYPFRFDFFQNFNFFLKLFQLHCFRLIAISSMLNHFACIFISLSLVMFHTLSREGFVNISIPSFAQWRGEIDCKSPNWSEVVLNIWLSNLCLKRTHGNHSSKVYFTSALFKLLLMSKKIKISYFNN